jgi:ribosomal small subunit protein bTHX
MGKGDIKTRRGKLFRGTYGARRRRKKARKTIPEPAAKIIAPQPSKVTAMETPDKQPKVIEKETEVAVGAEAEKAEAGKVLVKSDVKKPEKVKQEKTVAEKVHEKGEAKEHEKIKQKVVTAESKDVSESKTDKFKKKPERQKAKAKPGIENAGKTVKKEEVITEEPKEKAKTKEVQAKKKHAQTGQQEKAKDMTRVKAKKPQVKKQPSK